MSFYGNTTGAQSKFQFDKIYHNYEELKNNAKKDNIFLNRYVLIEYGEGSSYTENYNIDKSKHGRSYDSTVWQKVYDENEEKYKMIAELNVPKITGNGSIQVQAANATNEVEITLVWNEFCLNADIPEKYLKRYFSGIFFYAFYTRLDYVLAFLKSGRGQTSFFVWTKKINFPILIFTYL